jgi:hypothetical protein
MNPSEKSKVYTTSKIYFVVKDIEVFKTKYDTYFNELEEVYKTGNHTYEGKYFYNIQLDFKKGMLNQSDFNNIMNEFIKDVGQKADIKSAYYKYKNNDSDVKLYWKNPLLG